MRPFITQPRCYKSLVWRLVALGEALPVDGERSWYHLQTRAGLQMIPGTCRTSSSGPRADVCGYPQSFRTLFSVSCMES